MTPTQAKKLKIGSRVRWSDGVLGTVIDKNWHALQIKWDDSCAAIYCFNDNEAQWNEMEQLGIRIPI